MGFADDTFAGTTTSDLGGQSASDGGTWTARDGTGTVVGNGAGAIGSGSASRGGYYHSGTPASADYTVSGDITITSSGKSSLSLAARMNTASNEQYFIRWSGGIPGWEIYRRTGGSETSMWNGASGTVPTTTVAATLEVSGSNISLYLNGSLAQTVTNSAITSAGKAGIYNFFADAGGSTIDNFSASDPVVAGGQPISKRFGGVPGMGRGQSFGSSTWKRSVGGIFLPERKFA